MHQYNDRCLIVLISVCAVGSFSFLFACSSPLPSRVVPLRTNKPNICDVVYLVHTKKTFFLSSSFHPKKKQKTKKIKVKQKSPKTRRKRKLWWWVQVRKPNLHYDNLIVIIYSIQSVVVQCNRFAELELQQRIKIAGEQLRWECSASWYVNITFTFTFPHLHNIRV